MRSDFKLYTLMERSEGAILSGERSGLKVYQLSDIGFAFYRPFSNYNSFPSVSS